MRMLSPLCLLVTVYAAGYPLPSFGQSAVLRESLPVVAPYPAPLLTPHRKITEKSYVGLGVKRSAYLMAFPFHHPVKVFHKTTFPLRHPLMAFENFGHIMEPYQPALNATSALAGPVTAAGVLSVRR